MTNDDSRSIRRTPELNNYILNTWVDEPPAAAGLRQATSEMTNSGMQIAPDQGRLLNWLASMIGARRCIEVGVFTGYSSLWTALALPPDGQLVSCDVSTEWTSIGRPYWEQAGVSDQIDLRIAPAAQTLESLRDEGQAGQFDMAFIDADKSSYDTYYELCLDLLRPNGIIAVDNVLWSGAVADNDYQDSETKALRALNAKMGADPRIDVALLAIGDGLTVARKLA